MAPKNKLQTKLVTRILALKESTQDYWVGEVRMSRQKDKNTRPLAAATYGCELARSYKVSEHIVENRFSKEKFLHAATCPNANIE